MSEAKPIDCRPANAIVAATRKLVPSAKRVSNQNDGFRFAQPILRISAKIVPMRQIPIGAKGTYTLRVMPAHLANQFKDAMLPEVFATPMMITAMENAALNAIRDYLDPSESAVGTAVDIRHLAATPVGHQVTAQAEVT